MGGEKLFKFLPSLMLHEFYGRAIIRLEASKVTHVEAGTRLVWRYHNLHEKPLALLGRADGSHRHPV